jgi:hypothetical protein
MADVFDSRQDEAGEIRVRFGPGPSQTMPIDWAEAMLTKWKNDHEAQFGKALSDAAVHAE